MEQHTDERLWRLAKKRAGFKRSLTTYIIMNLFFWAIWWFTQGQDGYQGSWAGVWPIWPMLGWGIGIAFQYFDAYGNGDKETMAIQEYEKLKKQQEG